MDEKLTSNLYKDSGKVKPKKVNNPKVVTSISTATQLSLDGQEVWVANPDHVRRLSEKIDSLIAENQNLSYRISTLEHMVTELKLQRRRNEF